MNENVDITIYVNSLINDLNEESFFDEKINPLMDENILRNKVTEVAVKNQELYGEPTLDVIQFETAIFEARKAVIAETVESLYNKELLDVVAINEEGESLYAPSQKAKELYGDINKKNI